MYIHYYFVTKLCRTLLRPHGLQPNRLLYPWNFPGENTGVGCHFLFQGIFLTQWSNLRLPHTPTLASGLWATWEARYIIFIIYAICSPLLLLSKKVKVKVLVNQSLWSYGSVPHQAPYVHGILQVRILEWVAIPFSRGFSQIRNWTWVSSIAGKFFTIWATREAIFTNNFYLGSQF